MLQTSTFQRVFLNSLVWTLFVVVFQFVVGIGTALLLGQRFAGRGVLRALVIIPWVMPGIIGGILWKLMYEPYLGLVNHALLSAGSSSRSSRGWPALTPSWRRSSSRRSGRERRSRS